MYQNILSVAELIVVVYLLVKVRRLWIAEKKKATVLAEKKRKAEKELDFVFRTSTSGSRFLQ